jgi:hypothetical protein
MNDIIASDHSSKVPLFYLYADLSKKTLLHRDSNVTRFRPICDVFPPHM